MHMSLMESCFELMEPDLVSFKSANMHLTLIVSFYQMETGGMHLAMIVYVIGTTSQP